MLHTKNIEKITNFVLTYLWLRNHKEAVRKYAALDSLIYGVDQIATNKTLNWNSRISKFLVVRKKKSIINNGNFNWNFEIFENLNFWFLSTMILYQQEHNHNTIDMNHSNYQHDYSIRRSNDLEIKKVFSNRSTYIFIVSESKKLLHLKIVRIRLKCK